MWHPCFTHISSRFSTSQTICHNHHTTRLRGFWTCPPNQSITVKLHHVFEVESRAKRDWWRAKFPGIPFDLIMIQGVYDDTSFPPKMMVDGTYIPRSFKFTRPPPFSIDLVEAVKRQIVFDRKITSIYSHDPVLDALLLDSRQHYAKFMNLT
jgi:hypothetical protein